MDAQIESLAASRDRRLLVVNGTTAYEVIGDDAHPVTLDGGEPLSDVLAVAFAEDGTAFAIAEDGLWREGSAGCWVRIAIQSDRPRANRLKYAMSTGLKDRDKVDESFRRPGETVHSAAGAGHRRVLGDIASLDAVPCIPMLDRLNWWGSRGHFLW